MGETISGDKPSHTISLSDENFESEMHETFQELSTWRDISKYESDFRNTQDWMSWGNYMGHTM